jgi:hypothetical protein
VRGARSGKDAAIQAEHALAGALLLALLLALLRALLRALLLVLLLSSLREAWGGRCHAGGASCCMCCGGGEGTEAGTYVCRFVTHADVF